MTTEEKVKKIKQSFRLYMNGVTAQSLREKGSSCKISWGISIGHLQEMASEYGKDYSLAVELWKNDIRECKLLATMIMPAEEMLPEVADIWMDDMPTQEIAQQLVLQLLQHVDFAPELAFRWMSMGDDMRQMVAFTLLGRLFMQQREPDERGINEFLDQAIVALHSDSPSVQHAAMNCIIRFADLSPEYNVIATKATKREGFDFL